MKKLLIVFIVVFGGCSQDEQVLFADGDSSQMSHWDGRWLVINYWAEWCAPCRHEIPELNDLHHERVKHGLVVLGVNWDALSGDKLVDVATRMDIKFPTLTQDPFLKYDYERPMQLPTTILINPQRQVHDTLVGPQTAASIMAAIN